MTEHRCDGCNRGFDSAEALQQHNFAKHTTQQIRQPSNIRPKAGSGRMFLIVIVLLAVIGGAYFVVNGKPAYVILSPYSEHSKGTGAITILEYSDFQCPVCKTAYPEANKIVAQYGDKVRFVYKHFPLTSIHTYAFKAAEASECAADQGKFWEYHNKLFDNQEKLDIGSLKKYAGELGLDTDNFNKCLDSGVMGSIVSSDREEGKGKGISGTPTFFVNGQKNVGVLTVDKFRQLSGL